MSLLATWGVQGKRLRERCRVQGSNPPGPTQALLARGADPENPARFFQDVKKSRSFCELTERHFYHDTSGHVSLIAPTMPLKPLLLYTEIPRSKDHPPPLGQP